MTTNGLTFMIPFQGTFSDYKQLFYEEVLEGDKIKGTENRLIEILDVIKLDGLDGAVIG